jgi:hypothetical protein
MPSLREAWTGIVEVDDYETFMASIGQAQANARLIGSMLPSEPERVLFAGAGAGQMLEYLDPSCLAPHQLFFTDINPNFLLRLGKRLHAAGLSNYRLIVDDLENSALAGTFHTAIVVLVLEHIDWRRGVQSLTTIAPRRCCIIIQENPPDMTSAVTPGRVPQGSMSVFVEARPKLIPADELLDAMTEQGYVLDGRRAEEVADGKRMIGFSWRRSA